MATKKRELYVVYRKTGSKGYGTYESSIHDDSTNKTLARGGFPTVSAIKKWANQWARAKNGKVTYEKV